MHFIWDTLQNGKFPHTFESKYTIFWVELVYGMAYEIFYCVGIAVNKVPKISGKLLQWHCNCLLGEFQTTGHGHHPTKYGRLVQWHCDFFFWGYQITGHSCHQKQYVHLLQWHCNCLFWEFQTTEHCHNPKKYGHLVHLDCNFFSWGSKWLGIVISRNIWNQHVFSVWVGYRFILNNVMRFIV